MREEKIIKFTKIILDIMYFSGMIVVVTLPFTLKLAGEYYSVAIAQNYYKMLVVFASSSIFGIFILGQLRKMMKTVICDDCFVWQNVKSLEIMSVCSFSISILFILKVFFVPTQATLIIILVFFIAALFCIVLSCVFRQAINYKEENDLTI